MKRTTLLLTFGLLAGNLFAQNTPHPIQTSIFFESGKAELNEKALSALESLIAQLPDRESFDLDIRAYTDDIGSTEYNRDLAARRAQAVEAFLKSRQLQPTQVDMAGVGEIALQANADADLQRQQNRRVDVNISTFAPQNLGDVFNYFGKRNTQTFCIRNHRDTTIVGKKGTIIFIPARSLCVADSKTDLGTTPINIELREAYSYQDMMLENLGTTSNGELIETGGMIYLEARTQAGAQVAIREGEELSMTMPSDKPLPKDMQVFVADRSINNPTAAINWQATNTPFTPVLYDKEVPDFPFKGIAKMEPLAILEPLEMPELRPEAPKKPLPVYAPKMHGEKPTMERCRKMYARYPKEADETYEARLQTLLERDLKTHERNVADYEKKMAEYEQKLIQREKDMAQYRIDSASYTQQNDVFLQWLITDAENIKNWLDDIKWTESGLDQRLVAVALASKKINDYRNYLVQEAQILKMTGLIEPLQQLQIKESSNTLRKIAASFVNCIRTGKKLSAERISTDEISEALSFVRYASTLDSTKLANYIVQLKESVNFQMLVHKMYVQVKGINTNFAFFNPLIENYNEVLQKSSFRQYAAELDAQVEPLQTLHDSIIGQKLIVIGDQTKLRNSYMNQVGIKSFGWINCDRFSSTPKEVKTNLMLTDNNIKIGDTQFYVFFKDIKCVMPMSSMMEGYVAANIPGNERVEIVGLRIIDGKPYIAKTSGLVRDLAGKAVPEFKESSLGGLRNLLNS